MNEFNDYFSTIEDDEDMTNFLSYILTAQGVFGSIGFLLLIAVMTCF